MTLIIQSGFEALTVEQNAVMYADTMLDSMPELLGMQFTAEDLTFFATSGWARIVTPLRMASKMLRSIGRNQVSPKRIYKVQVRIRKAVGRVISVVVGENYQDLR